VAEPVSVFIPEPHGKRLEHAAACSGVAEVPRALVTVVARDVPPHAVAAFIAIVSLRARIHVVTGSLDDKIPAELARAPFDALVIRARVVIGAFPVPVTCEAAVPPAPVEVIGVGVIALFSLINDPVAAIRRDLGGFMTGIVATHVRVLLRIHLIG